MCGITGLVNFDKKLNISESLLRNMAQPLNYRGPDQEGFEVCTDLNYELGFAHKRLSIIDLSESGKQPMYSYSKKSLIVFNGEIYNYLELRSQLIDLGYSFQSLGDAEVVLNSYKEWGKECLHPLRRRLFFFFCPSSNALSANLFRFLSKI